MLVINTTSNAVVIELEYYRMFIPTKTITKDKIKIQVDDGPNILKRARQALCEQIDIWNQAGPTLYDWKYWSK